MFSVLLVDDEPDLLEVAKLHLEKDGEFSVDTCGSAPTALTAVEKKSYDAVIADYDMPVMTGLDLLRELKRRGHAIPFIMMTGVDSEKIVMDTLNSGGTYFIRKGTNLDDPFGDLADKLCLAMRQNTTGRNRQIFSAISRHDLLNHVAAISSYIELVEAQTSDIRVLEYMKKQQVILSAIKEQIQFIGDYEKIGTTQPAWQPLLPIINHASALLPQDLIRFSVKGIETIELFADPLLVNVFYNLVDNSLRHGRHVTEIRITGSAGDDSFCITLEDNGIGVAAGEKETIFLRGRGKNTGLGLFLIREILATTDIRIRETGIPGKGARFEILVPKENCRIS